MSRGEQKKQNPSQPKPAIAERSKTSVNPQIYHSRKGKTPVGPQLARISEKVCYNYKNRSKK